MKLQVTHVGVISLSLVPLGVVQCDQTTFWATPRIMCREEVGQSLQGRVRFLLRVRLQHGNYLDCSIGAFSARRWGLGIFALAALTSQPDKHVHVLFDPFSRIPKEDRLRTQYANSPLIVLRMVASGKRKAGPRLKEGFSLA